MRTTVEMKWGVAVAVFAIAALVEGALAARPPRFIDVSEEAGFLRRDQLHLVRETRNKYFGSTVADIDRDGYYDVVMSNHAQNPEMYRNNGDGTYKYVDPKLLLYDFHATAAADVDNDGELDLFINTGGGRGDSVTGVPLSTMSSTASTRFNRKNAEAYGMNDIPARGRSMSFMDIDCDGYLDYVLVNRRNLSATFSHLVYRNNGKGSFEFKNLTGIEEVQAAWFHTIDVNNDSYMDLLLMDVSNTELWLGTGDFKFVQGSDLLPGVRQISNARSAAEIDYNNDGHMDIMIVTGSQTKIVDDVLYENLGDGTYAKINVADVGLPLGGKHYHVTTGDLNNDGFVDMFISRLTWFEAPRLNDLVLMNNGDKTFSVLENAVELASKDPLSDGDNANIFDYDGDGLNDILVGSRNSTWSLFKNKTPRWMGHYLRVRVGSPRAETGEPLWFKRKALGALVKVFCGSEQWMQRVGSQGQSHSQSYMDTLVFGLGQCTFVDRVEIHYTGDIVVVRENVKVDSLVTIGIYNTCPPGKHGLKCRENLKPCRKEACNSDEVCEVATLVRNKCREEACSRPVVRATNPERNLLKNPDFNIAFAWERIGKAQYNDDAVFQGRLSMRLPYAYSEVQQPIHLSGNAFYKLSCKVLFGPIIFQILDGTTVVQKSMDGEEIPITDSQWSLKEMEFKIATEGEYVIGILTELGSKGVVDDCSLRRINKNLLLNGDMESDEHWVANGDASFVEGAGFGDSAGVELGEAFAQLKQRVEIIAGTEYALSCKTQGDVRYKINYNGSFVSLYDGEAEPIPDSPWGIKTLAFTPSQSGIHDLKIMTKSGTSGVVDDCSLSGGTPPPTPPVPCEDLDCLTITCPL